MFANDTLCQNPPKFDWKDKKLLHVDDDMSSTLLVEEILFESGIEFINVGTGKEAIEKLKQYPDINVILLELRLPDISGFDTFQGLKEINPKIPIIANTATVSTEMVKKCIRLGFFGFLAKPAYIEDYLKIINKALNL